MAKRVDWYYHRKGWTSCKRADSFLEGRDVTVRETVDAKKERFGAGELKKLFTGANKIVAARGKKEVVFDLKKEPPSKEVLEKHVLGPSGNLRAPAMKLGKTWLIGYAEETYETIFG